VRALPALTLALLVLVPLATPARAGSATNPEMQGNPNELLSTSGTTTIGTPEARLAAAWFDEPNDTTVRVTWQVVDLAHRLRPDEVLSFEVGCGSAGQFVSVVVSVGGPFPQPVGWFSKPGAAVDATVTTSGNTISATIPRAAWPAPECRGPAASTSVAFKNPTCPCWSSGIPGWGQRAPDAGTGRSFTF
jgi:hypothetical protein